MSFTGGRKWEFKERVDSDKKATESTWKLVFVETGPDVPVELYEDKEYFEAHINFEQGLRRKKIKERAEVEIFFKVENVQGISTSAIVFVTVFFDFINLVVFVLDKAEEIVCQIFEGVFGSTEVIERNHIIF